MVKHCVALLMLLWCGVLSAQEIKVRVESTELREDESFRVVFETDTAPDGDPDFSVLERDFEILGQNSSSSLQAVNGQFTRQYLWVVTLLPKRLGEVNLPMVVFGSRNSEPVTVNVSKSEPLADGEEPELFFEIEASPQELYVQQSLLYTVRLYRSVVVGNSRIGQPQLSSGDAIVERLDDGRSYEQMRNGKRHVVVQRRYAIFPQQSGPLAIEPIVFEGQIIQRGALPRVKRLRSDPVSLDVKPIPADYSGKVWLPSKRVTLDEDLSLESNELTAGEPITWTVTLKAEGLTSTQLPEMELTWDDRLNAYPEKPQLRDRVIVDGITGESQQKIAVIATEPGEYTLPEISVVWWNTVTDREETAILPARTIQVNAAPGYRVQNQNPTVVTPVIPNEANTQVNGSAQDPVGIARSAPWKDWLLLVLAAGWLVTLLGWLRSRPAQKAVVHEAEVGRTQELEKTEQSLKVACRANRAQGAKDALLSLARQQGLVGNIRSLSGLAEATSPDLAKEILALNETLYASSGDDWQGANLWRLWKKEPKSQTSKRPRHGTEVLHPLVGS